MKKTDEEIRYWFPVYVDMNLSDPDYVDPDLGDYAYVGYVSIEECYEDDPWDEWPMETTYLQLNADPQMRDEEPTTYCESDLEARQPDLSDSDWQSLQILKRRYHDDYERI